MKKQIVAIFLGLSIANLAMATSPSIIRKELKPIKVNDVESLIERSANGWSNSDALNSMIDQAIVGLTEDAIRDCGPVEVRSFDVTRQYGYFDMGSKEIKGDVEGYCQ